MRDGVRFPSDKGGEPSGQSGPVISYRVSPEEIEARFGPPKYPSRRAVPAPVAETNEVEVVEPVSKSEGRASVANMIRAESMPVEPRFILGAASILVVDLPEKAAALATLLGPEAVLVVENGILVVRAR